MGNMRNHSWGRSEGRALAIVCILLIVLVGMQEVSTISAAEEEFSISRQLVFEVLSSFKRAISNDPLRALASWNTSSSAINPCTSNWTGISCKFLSNGSSPDLISSLSIDLHNLSLKGSVSADLARLGPALSYLDLSVNLLSGTFPSLSNFSTLQNLKNLSLAQNSFYGRLTLPTSYFPSLLFLSVAENSFSGPLPSDQLSRCPSLQFLNVSNNHFVGSFFPSGLGNLTATLYTLDGGINNFSGPIPPSIGNCSLLNFLSFPFNHFSGPLPSSIGLGCPNLTFVSLFENSLSGNIPKEMRMLSQLSYLSIGLNNFTGTIFDIVANCTALTILDISQMLITGQLPDDIGSRHPNLAVLGLELNLLTGSIPESLGNCSRLNYLLMGFNHNISGRIPPRLFEAQFISQLDLQHNSLTGSIPHQIGNLTSLQKAYLNNNKFTGSLPEELSKLASIQALTFQYNSLSGNFPSQLFNCTTLIGLNLSHNQFLGPIMSSIGLLGNLNGFDASLNQLTGQLPLGLSNCTNLRAISLSNNMLRGEIPISIIQGLAKSCNSFELAHNNLTGLIPNTEFQHMTFLQTLDLSYNQLSGPVPSGLAGCLGLQSLNLSQNKLVGPIPSELGGALLSLIDLDLSHNYINGSIPEELGRLQSLQELDLSSNALSGTIPLELANLKGLRYLNLSYNSQLQGKVPDGGIFGNLTKMSFLGNPMLCGIAVNKTCTISSTSDGLSKEWKIVIIVASALIFLIIVLVSILILLHYYRRNLKKERAEGKASWDFDPYLRLTLEDIRQATSNFSADNILGAGATGTVYKGILRDGTILAFKKFNLDNSSIQSFFGELESVGRIRHRNLIKILGYFSNQVDANILILEYMPNGSLQDQLHGQDHVGLSSWDARLRVARSVAEGLFYLHNDGPTPIIHCDLKPQNILFDEKMEVHITDFGLANVLSVLTATSSLTENVKGTFGYMAPEMASFGHISRKCDIYSYGILLMELIGGRSPLGEGHAVEFSSGEDEGTTTLTALVQWVSVKYDADEMLAIVDKRLQETIGENEINQMKELLHLALQCTQTNPKQRPTMQQVQQVLSSGSVASSIDKAKELLIRLENPPPDTPERDSF